MEVLFGLVFIIVATVVYFLPTFIAIKWKHYNILPLFILNIFFGWSAIGWVAALMWAVWSGQSRHSDEKSFAKAVKGMRRRY